VEKPGTGDALKPSAAAEMGGAHELRSDYIDLQLRKERKRQGSEGDDAEKYKLRFYPIREAEQVLKEEQESRNGISRPNIVKKTGEATTPGIRGKREKFP